MGKIYAVRIGRIPGIYGTWTECEAQVKGFSGAIYKSFPTKSQAVNFIGNMTPSNVSRTPSNVHMTPSSVHMTPSSVPSVDNNSSNRNDINIWTDGSFRNGTAGYAVLDGQRVVHYGPVSPATNNRGELTAILRACQLYRNSVIHSDSQYSIRTLTEWMPSWIRRYGEDPLKWRTSTGGVVANIDLLVEISKYLKDVSFVHVKAHSGIEENEIVDHWANEGRMLKEERIIQL